jgi:hypothetical protein
MNQRSEAMISSLVEGMRSECESTPVNVEGGVHIGSTLTDWVPIQHDIAESLSHSQEDNLEATNQSDTTVIPIREEMNDQSKLSNSQELAELAESENKTVEVIAALLENAEASSAGKLSQSLRLIKANYSGFVPFGGCRAIHKEKLPDCRVLLY